MYYTTSEAAKLLGFTVETIRRKINRNEIMAIKLRKRHMIPTDEIRKYLLNMVGDGVSEEEKNLIVDDILNKNKSR